jgi:hypothetical protein
MRTQSVWRPVGPDHGAEIERLHLKLKLAADLYPPEFLRWAIEQKVRCQNSLRFLRSELRHLGSFISEWFCVSEAALLRAKSNWRSSDKGAGVLRDRNDLELLTGCTCYIPNSLADQKPCHGGYEGN